MPTTAKTEEPAKAASVTRVVKFCIDSRAFTQRQRDLFERHAGTGRAVWNWGLSVYNERERTARRIRREAAGAEALRRFGNDERDSVLAVFADADWRREASKRAYEQAGNVLPLTGKKVNGMGLDAEFTAMAKTGTAYGFTRDGEPKDFGWWVEEKHGVSRNAVNQPLRALDIAVSDFYSGKSKRGSRKRKDGMPSGWPTFKSKRDPGQFAILNLSTGKDGAHDILRAPAGSGHRLRIPNLGLIPVHNQTKRLRRYIAKGGVPKSARFTQVADRWYVSINVSFAADNPYVAPAPTSRRAKRNGPVGMDRGVTALLALSNGEMHGQLKPGRDLNDVKVRAQRKAARARRLGHKTEAKRWRMRVARFDHLAALRRQTALHVVTKHLATNYPLIVVEDLRLSSMTRSVTPKPDPDNPGQYLKNGKRSKAGLNRSMLDAALGEIHRMLQYKCERYGSSVAKVNPAYTSEDCSACNHREKKHRSDKTKNRKSQAVFECVACGFTCNADINAAINILNRYLGLPGSAGGEASTAGPRMGVHEATESGVGQPTSAPMLFDGRRPRNGSPSSSHTWRSDPPRLLNSA